MYPSSSYFEGLRRTTCRPRIPRVRSATSRWRWAAGGLMESNAMKLAPLMHNHSFQLMNIVWQLSRIGHYHKAGKTRHTRVTAHAAKHGKYILFPGISPVFLTKFL